MILSNLFSLCAPPSHLESAGIIYAHYCTWFYMGSRHLNSGALIYMITQWVICLGQVVFLWDIFGQRFVGGKITFVHLGVLFSLQFWTEYCCRQNSHWTLFSGRTFTILPFCLQSLIKNWKLIFREFLSDELSSTTTFKICRGYFSFASLLWCDWPTTSHIYLSGVK